MKTNQFKKTFFLPLKALILGLSISSGSLFAQTLPLPNNLIPFNSAEGEKLLIESQSRKDYIPLSIQFVTQKNQAFCGVASSIMVLNALGLTPPATPEYSPYNTFTQDNFFNSEKTRAVIAPELVARQGMTVDELGRLLESHGAKAKVYHGADVKLEEFRKLIVDNLNQANNFVIVNYLRKAINQEKGGHISPIAAYNKEIDRFLILDVSRYKYQPVWVKANELWQATNTLDSTSGKTRGFVLVTR